jgi:hypothetical protein
MKAILPLVVLGLGGLGAYKYSESQKAKKALPAKPTPKPANGTPAPGPDPALGIALTVPYTALNEETIEAAIELAQFTKKGEITVWLTPEAQKSPEAINAALYLALQAGETALAETLKAMLAALREKVEGVDYHVPGEDQPGGGVVPWPTGVHQPDKIYLDHLPDGQTVLFPPLVQDELHRMGDVDGRHFVWIVNNSRNVATLNAAAEFYQFMKFPASGDYIRALRALLETAGQTGEWDVTYPTDRSAAFELAWQKMVGIR